MGKRGPIRLGIIGAGMIGSLHAQNLAWRIRGAELRSVADASQAALGACVDAIELPHVDVYRDYRHLLEDAQVDAVAICTPRETHSAIVREVAAAGKHIFCEKPIGCDLREIDGALAAVARAGVKLQVGFNRRFDPTYRRVHELVAAGAVGWPSMIHIISRDPELPGVESQTREDLFLDMTVHDFDMARFLIGDEIESLWVVASTARPAAVIGESVLTVFRFASGVIGAIDNSLRSAAGYDQRVEVFGSAGRVSSENETADRARLSDAAGVHSAAPLHFFRERYAVSYVAEMESFIRCIREDTAPPVTGEDGRWAVAVSLAALRSLCEQTPVSLPSLASKSASASKTLNG